MMPHLKKREGRKVFLEHPIASSVFIWMSYIVLFLLPSMLFIFLLQPHSEHTYLWQKVNLDEAKGIYADQGCEIF